MASAPDLSGHRVLVVEDDYYIATDMTRGLQGAGAAIIGPHPSEAAATAALETERPDAAVIDINLGSGPSFGLARALTDQGVPFVFVTGYNADVVPVEFRSVERLEKPTDLRRVVDAVAKTLGGPP